MIPSALLVIALASTSQAAIEAEDASDYVRILESGEPSLWSEAVWRLLGETGELDRYAVASVVRRLDYLEPELRVRVAQSLREHAHTLPTLWELAHDDPDGAVRAAAMSSLLGLRGPGAMDAYAALIDNDSPYRGDALRALVALFAYWTSEMDGDVVDVEIDPVLAPDNGTPGDVFDRRYLGAVSSMLRSDDPQVRKTALSETSSLDSRGLREEWLRLTHDADPSIREEALWTLAGKGDPRPCPTLIAETTQESDIEAAGWKCAPSSYLDYFDRYQRGEDVARFKSLIEGATRIELLDHPEVVEAVAPYANHSDSFLRETARTILEWRDRARDEARAADVRLGVRPIVLMGCAFVSFVLGAVLFVWAFRLYLLLVRVRRRPVSKIASMPMGPVALEGKVEPAGGLLRHPLTDEPCVYYAGADVEHPEARFFLVDDSGRVLVDPRRAVLFSDDGVLVTGERVHLVAHAGRDYGKVVVGKDASTPPLYRRVGHRIIEALFGFGPKTSVSKMLFTDPSRCFWIWDDLERRPMGEAGDVLWLAASVLLAGAWIVVFAVSILGIVDQEMSASLARAIAAP
jgi:HEAT repeat protein